MATYSDNSTKDKEKKTEPPCEPKVLTVESAKAHVFALIDYYADCTDCPILNTDCLLDCIDTLMLRKFIIENRILDDENVTHRLRKRRNEVFMRSVGTMLQNPKTMKFAIGIIADDRAKERMNPYWRSEETIRRDQEIKMPLRPQLQAPEIHVNQLILPQQQVAQSPQIQPLTFDNAESIE